MITGNLDERLEGIQLMSKKIFNIIMGVCVVVFITAIIILLSIINSNFTPSYYLIDNPNSEVLKMLEEEYMLKIPEEMDSSRIIGDNSKDNTFSLSFTGAIDISVFLESQIDFKITEVIKTDDLHQEYMITGYPNNETGVLKIICLGDENYKIIISKSGINNVELYNIILESSIKA